MRQCFLRIAARKANFSYNETLVLRGSTVFEIKSRNKKKIIDHTAILQNTWISYSNCFVGFLSKNLLGENINLMNKFLISLNKINFKRYKASFLYRRVNYSLKSGFVCIKFKVSIARTHSNIFL